MRIQQIPLKTHTMKNGSLLINSVGEAPAVPGVAVSVPRVDEAVLEWSADIVSRQTCDRGHHVSGELADLESAFVLTSPPVVLRPDGENLRMKQDQNKKVQTYNGAGGRAAYPPPFYNGDDIVDLDAEFVRLVKVLQSTHVCGHGLEKTQKIR